MSDAQSHTRHAGLLPRVGDLEAVIFDFDGVILESAVVKDRAFEELFSHMPELVPQILAHHHENLGVSRFEKFDWIYRNLLGRSPSAQESRRLGERFSDLVQHGMKACTTTPGALDLLDALKGTVPCFVVSGTPQQELDALIDERGFRSYFVETWGSPPEKSQTLRRILERHRFNTRAVIAIGDGLSDYTAANAFGVPFVARFSPESGQDWSGYSVFGVETLAEMIPLLGLDEGSRQ